MTLASLLILAVFIGWRVDPLAEYHAQGIVFLANSAFFARFSGLPGGWVDYAAAWLAQLNAIPVVAALAFTALGAGLVLALRALSRQAAGRSVVWTLWVPVLLLAAWRGRYDVHATGTALGLLVTLAAAALAGACARGPVGWQCLVAALGAGLVFRGAGLWPLALFVFLTGWVAGARRGAKGAGLVPAAALAGAVMAWGGHLPPLELNPWGKGWGPAWGAAILGWPVILAALLRLLPAGARSPAAVASAPPPAGAKRAGGKHPPVRPVSGPGRPPARPGPATAATLAALCAGWVVVWAAMDAPLHAMAEVCRAAALKQYDAVLAAAAGLQTMPGAVEIRCHLALYHSGRLTEDLFTVANRGPGKLLPGMQGGIATALPQCQTLMELGQVNEVEHLAQESLEMEGERPETLRLLAQVNVLKDRPRAAVVFLNFLSEVPCQGAWAAERLAGLDTNPRWTGDRDLDLTRSRMPTTDLPHDALPGEVMLLQCLDSNPKNQMAYEYLLAHYLLIGDFKRLARQAARLRDFSYLAVPRHVEEALLLAQKSQGLEFDLQGLKIRPETIQNFQRFGGAVTALQAAGRASAADLPREFAGTFWYYYYAQTVARAAAGH